MLITQLHLCLLAVAARRRCQPQAAPPHTLRSNPHHLPLPPLSPLSNYKFRTQMRLINKYETSMRARGWEHYRSTVGAGVLARTGAATREPVRNWTPLGYIASGMGRAAKITQEINIQVGHSERGLRHSPKRERTRATVSGERSGVLQSRLDCP